MLGNSNVRVPPYIPEDRPVRISFVGEAPSTEELIKGQPLVGPSGRTFNAMLRAANLDRDAFHITNLFDQMIPGDGDTEIAKNRSMWLNDAVRVAENFARLTEELALARPNVIVPLGGTALWGFLGETGIAKYRGAVSAATRIRPGAKLIPTYHPSAVNRNWPYMPIVVGDFNKAWTQSAFPEIRYPKVELLVEPSVDDVRRFAEECKSARKLSVDIETGWGQITTIQFAVPSTPPRAMSIPFVDLRKSNKCYWLTAAQELEVWKIVRDVLESPVPKVGQNFSYDFFWLFDKRGIVVRNFRSDTRLRHKVLYPEWPADLGTMGAMYTDIGVWKMWAGRYQKDTDKKDS